MSKREDRRAAEEATERALNTAPQGDGTAGPEGGASVGPEGAGTAGPQDAAEPSEIGESLLRAMVEASPESLKDLPTEFLRSLPHEGGEALVRKALCDRIVSDFDRVAAAFRISATGRREMARVLLRDLGVFPAEPE